jgi:hypothetical protein
MSDCTQLTTLKVSIQRALLDVVTNRLVAVTCGLNGTSIRIDAFFQGRVTSADVEQFGNVGAEVIADFPELYTVEEHCQSTDDLEPKVLDFWAFRRLSKPRQREGG